MIRLVQISDTHICAGETEDIDTLKAFERVFEHIKKGPAFEAILHTGDISHQGDAPSYQRLAQKIKHYQKTIYATPGNHDDLMEIRENLRPMVECVHSVNMGNHWQVLFLNSKVEGEPHGHIDDDDLIWLENWLGATTDKYTLIATHHPPIDIGSESMDAIKMDNGDALISSLAKYPNVKGIVFGHIHQIVDTTVHHIRLLGCPSTCIQFSPIQPEKGEHSAQSAYRSLILEDDGTLNTDIIFLKNTP